MMELKIRSLNLVVETYSAPSCVFLVSSGVCKICHNLLLCSCKAYRWCARGSAFSGHCYWRNVCHIRQTHI